LIAKKSVGPMSKNFDNKEIRQVQYETTQLEVLRDVIACLGKYHIAVYDINLETGYYKEVSVITAIPRFSPNEGDFSACVEEICTYTIGEAYRAAIRIFLDLSTMAERLKNKDIINIRFQNIIGKWREATIIANHRNSSGEVITILYLTSDIDSLKRKELEYQKALEKSNREKDAYLEKLLQERQEKEAYYVKSRLDQMTGLLLKHVFFEEGQQYLDDNPDKGVGVIFIDIDNFKRINDQYGHQFGDVAIQKVADILSTSLAHKDLICRYGGDEFCILMKDIVLEKLEDKLNFILSKLHLILADEEQSKKITCSLGAVYKAAGIRYCKLEELIGQSDAATYSSKKTGKNKYTVKLFE